jgi:hypothetical protein
MYESMPKEIGNRKFKLTHDIVLRIIKNCIQTEGTKLNLSFEEILNSCLAEKQIKIFEKAFNSFKD